MMKCERCGKELPEGVGKGKLDKIGRLVFRDAQGQVKHLHTTSEAASKMSVAGMRKRRAGTDSKADKLVEQLRAALDPGSADYELRYSLVEQLGRHLASGSDVLRGLELALRLTGAGSQPAGVCQACGRDASGAIPLKLTASAARELAILLANEDQRCTREDCSRRVGLSKG